LKKGGGEGVDLLKRDGGRKSKMEGGESNPPPLGRSSWVVRLEGEMKLGGSKDPCLFV